MKICHVTSAHPKEDKRIYRKECVSIAKAGYDTYLVQQGESYEKENVHIVGFGNQEKSRLKRFVFSAKRAYKKAIEVNADIYHIHDPELLPYALKLKRKGKKVVFDSHEDHAHSIGDKYYIPPRIGRIIQYFYAKYENFVCRNLNAIVTVTPDLNDYFKTINSNSIIVSNYPVLKDLTTPNYSSRAVIYAGLISTMWSQNEIMQAIGNIKDVKYILLGVDYQNYHETLKSYSGWEKAVYCGNVPYEEVLNQMQKSSAGLALLKPGKDTFGQRGTLGNTKLFEEMMAGLPVICTDFDLWKEIIDKYNCGICVNPNSVEEITAAINKLLDNPELAEELGRNGRRAVEEEYNWATQEVKLLGLYKSLEEK